MNCAQCGQPARYIQQYGQWWCDACQHYTQGPAPAGVAAAGGAVQAAAPKSGIGGKVLKVFGVLFIIAAGLGVLGYFLNEKQAEVSVFCQGVEGGIECTADHQEGGATAQACFDVTVGCEDGSRASAKACMTVEPETKSSEIITGDKFTNQDTCVPVAGSLKLENLKVSEAD